MNKKGVICFSIILASSVGLNRAQANDSGNERGAAFACSESDKSISCDQKRQVEEIWVDMNKSYTQLADEVISNPSSAMESGCLDGIMQMDLSIITVDPKGIWSSVYAGIKDELMNLACNAAEKEVNEATAFLDAKLEAPMGLGNASVGRSGRVSGFNDVSNTRVEMTDTEAQREVVSEVFGEYPKVNRRRWTEQQVERRRVNDVGVSTRSRRTENEEKVEDVLDLNRIFDSNESNEGQ